MVATPLASYLDRRPIDRRCLIVSPHPDDETIGAAAIIMRAAECAVVHLTDGAPRDQRLWSSAAADRQAYARMRRDEALAAFRAARRNPEALVSLGIPDQELIHHIGQAATALNAIIGERQPDFVITTPYEGGHPDHDAAALVARIAVDSTRHPRPALIEMTSYHAGPGGIRTGSFLHDYGDVITIELTPEERAMKQAMFHAFTSQQAVLEWFGCERESFRVAPRYDFTRPPHEGQLWYEALGWPMTSAEWCRIASSSEVMA